VLWAVDVPIQTRASVPAATIGLIASVLIVLLLLVERPRSVRPSTLLTVYLLLTVLFDIAQARTLYLRSNIAIASVFTSALSTKLVLLLFEARSKRTFLKSPYDLLPKESICGSFSRICFW
jgi:ATP-binding cassette subfamily C (CFTR/MRP) protein 1